MNVCVHMYVCVCVCIIVHTYIHTCPMYIEFMCVCFVCCVLRTHTHNCIYMCIRTCFDISA